MKALFVVWQDVKNRRWAPVGRLTQEDGVYRFVYTRGAKEMSDFRPFGRMLELDKAYK